MLKFGQTVVKLRIPILILALLLLIPSALGIMHTRINYDMLDYLPSSMDTVKGQEILQDEFGKGAFSFVIVEGMSEKDVAALEAQIESVDHVESVLWYDDVADLSIPESLLPDKYYDAFNSGDATLLAVFFDTATSDDETIEAITQIRELAGKQCFVSGMSALVTDLKALCEREEPVYVGIAVLCCCAAMVLFLDSWVVPFVFLASIGMAIAYNMGTNYFLGEISYITKAIAAVLQLAVTMDYSIFLWHSFTEQMTIYPDKKEAMSHAIASTAVAILGSSTTTMAGFLALCFMSYTMGMDLGIVMAKGVLLGLIGSITTLPSLILIFDKALERTRHRTLIPNLDKLAGFITKNHWAFLAVFVVVLIPAAYGYAHTPVYYDFTHILSGSDVQSISSDDMQFLTANNKLEEDFDVATTEMVLCDADLPAYATRSMIDEIDSVEGVKYAVGLDSVVGSGIPEEMIPDEVKNDLESGDYKLILVNSSYKVSTDECNDQIDTINSIIKKYDTSGMLIGEAPCTKDLITVTDRDSTVVNWISIAAVFVIIALTMSSFSLPVILVAIIEFAIAINLGLAYFTNFSMPFIAPICIATIQLGSTVDYAILMTTRYKAERLSGQDKRNAVTIALATSTPSIIVSALGFFAATFGVAMYSDISIISSMCGLMARGAIVSMLVVIFILPSMLMLFDNLICRTTKRMRSLVSGKAVKQEVT